MANSRNRHPARRRFLKQAAALSAGAAAVGAPLLVLAREDPSPPADPVQGQAAACPAEGAPRDRGTPRAR